MLQELRLAREESLVETSQTDQIPYCGSSFLLRRDGYGDTSQMRNASGKEGKGERFSKTMLLIDR